MEQQNSLLRSAYQIAQRKGKNTNWDAFERNLLQELAKELWINDELDDQDIFRATCTPLTYRTIDESDATKIEAQVKSIPCNNFYSADRYDTDDEMVLHVWDKKDENSFDIRIPKHE